MYQRTTNKRSTKEENVYLRQEENESQWWMAINAKDKKSEPSDSDVFRFINQIAQQRNTHKERNGWWMKTHYPILSEFLLILVSNFASQSSYEPAKQNWNGERENKNWHDIDVTHCSLSKTKLDSHHPPDNKDDDMSHVARRSRKTVRTNQRQISLEASKCYHFYFVMLSLLLLLFGSSKFVHHVSLNSAGAPSAANVLFISCVCSFVGEMAVKKLLTSFEWAFELYFLLDWAETKPSLFSLFFFLHKWKFMREDDALKPLFVNPYYFPFTVSDI